MGAGGWGLMVGYEGKGPDNPNIRFHLLFMNDGKFIN